MNWDDLCGPLIKQIHDSVQKQIDNSLRQQGLTMSQSGVLLDLRNGPTSLKDLESVMNVAQSTMAGIIVRMEKNGFVESYIHPEDKRVKMVKLTKKGEDNLAIVWRNNSDTEKMILMDLTEEEVETFRKTLFKVKKNVNR